MFFFSFRDEGRTREAKKDCAATLIVSEYNRSKVYVLISSPQNSSVGLASGERSD